MFENLTNKLSTIFDRLRGRGALTEADVDAACREIRIALLEADVALQVAKDFIAKVRVRAIGHEVIASVTPGQQVVKIVHDVLVETLGASATPLNFSHTPPVPILMVGLQGSGKTTSSGKLAKRLKEVERKKVMLASLDTRRPAAQEQLAILAKLADVGSLPIIAGETPTAITKRALDIAAREGYDVIILDTAGRTAIDEELMAEVKAVRDIAQPAETLLVVDAMTGQDALNVAEKFHAAVSITGIIMTRLDGDARGGAALSMRAATGQPIKFFGSGEKLDAFEVYHPDRIAGRILDMGDVVSLVEKAAAEMDMGAAEKMAAKMQKGQFDFDDLADQLRQIRKMGGFSGIMGMMPGVGKIKQAMSEAKIDERIIKRQEAIITSMTKAERKNPDLLNASRKRRIAKGSGTDVAMINQLIKQYMQMRDMMKQMKKMGNKNFMRSMQGGGLENLLGKR
ncbi:MAG: signal recognition particle protein [Alphaproteobacteria bacterium]|nr:signal recognition particle protein [Alphaproteobacteria bacterium]